MISVLYVDDEPDLLEIARLFLEDTGEFRVGTALSAKRALDLPEIRSYDAIVSDYQMPGMDGIEFLKQVREHFGDIPFILFTGRGREEIVIAAINNGADFYLQKGGDPQAQFAELAHKIRQAVRRKQAEISLLESEHRYREVVETQTEFISRFRPDGTHVFVNDAYCRYFGLKREEIIGHVFRPAIPAGDRERVRRFFAALTPENPAGSIEHRIVMPDGSVRWNWWNDRAIYDPAGHVLEFQSVGKDITERRQLEEDLTKKHGELQESYEKLAAAEEELREQYEKLVRSERQIRNNEEELKSIYNTVGDVLFQLAVEPDGQYRFSSINSAFSRVTGLPPEQVIGKRVHQVIPEPSLPLVLEKYHQAIRERTIVRWEETSEYPTGRLTGEVTVAPLFDKDGNCTFLIGSVHDITERKEAERSLRESEAFLNSIIEQSPNPMWISDSTGTLLRLNRACAEMLRITDTEVVGKYNIFHDNIVEEQGFMPLVRNVFEKGEAVSFPLVYDSAKLAGIPLSHTVRRTLEVSIFPVKNPEGHITHAVIQHKDITEQVLAEDSLRESESRFATVFRSSPVALTLVSAAEGTFTDVNEAFVRESGYSREDVIGKTPGEVGIFVDKNEFGNLAAAMRDRQIVQGIELRVRRKSGGIRTCRFSAGILMMAGRPHILASVEDVTERRAADDALRESEAKLRIVLDNLPDLILVHRNGTILYANPAMIESMGVAPEDVLGRPILDYVAPEYHARVAGAIERRMQTGMDVPYQIEIISRVKGDRRSVVIRGSVIHFDGSPAILNVLIDVTARKDMQAALQTSEERFRTLVETSPDMIWETDLEGRFRYISPTLTTIMGYSPEEIIGKPIADLMPEEKRFGARPLFDRLVASGGHLAPFEVPARHRDGRGMILEIRPARVTGPDGKLIGFRGVARDITERRKAEEALHRMNRQLRLLSGITRHDILNKISVILGYLRVAGKKSDDPAMLGYIRKLESAVFTIRSQIEFTRVYETLGSQEPQWIALDAVMPRSQLPATVTLDAAVRGVSLYADPMLEKVFFNLLDNSIRHGERVTAIRVSFRKDGPDLVVVWEDNGTGIRAEDKDQIFERGFGEGTGLGMFLAREILSLTGITITECGKQGTGARFEIRAPTGAFRLDPQGGPAARNEQSHKDPEV